MIHISNEHIIHKLNLNLVICDTVPVAVLSYCPIQL